MARLEIVTDQVETADAGEIASFLAREGIEFGQHSLTAVARELAKKDVLSDVERTEVIASYAPSGDHYAGQEGFRADVVCFWPEFEHMSFVLSKFSPVHFHFENEWWYVIDGEASFGFLGSNGTKFILTVGVGEFCQVPEGIWQWFELTPAKRLKSIRYFNTSRRIEPREPVHFGIGLPRVEAGQ